MTTVDQTTDHVLTSDRRDFNGAAQFRPRCSCGWHVQHWADRDYATELGDDHLAANTPAPRLPKANVVQLDESAPEPSRRTQVAAGLRDLADWVEANPDQISDLYPSVNLLLSVGGRGGRDRIASIARTGLDAGVKVTKEYSEKWAGVKLHFGPHVTVDAYAARDEVCERVVVGTREETKEVPDPEALAAVPTVTVTETVEDVEWRCLPLLAVDGAR